MSELERKIKDIIFENGYMTVDYFMSIVVETYYKNSQSLGEQGDFITAPEVSQMFGEMIGIQVASYIHKKKFEKFSIVELGPGRGFLIADLLRATKHMQEVSRGLEHIVLYENSPKLVEIQKQVLLHESSRTIHIDNFIKLEEYCRNKTCIFIANEFFDALPVKQFQKIGNRVFEICLILNEKNEIEFRPYIPIEDHCCDLDTFIEISIQSSSYIDLISNTINQNGGDVILIDYGYLESKNTSTLQAVQKHKKVPVLYDIGNSDLTTLVNFKRLKEEFAIRSLRTKVIDQSEFLLNCGILERASMLSSNIKVAGESDDLIYKQLEMLISKDKMGSLFKVLLSV